MSQKFLTQNYHTSVTISSNRAENDNDKSKAQLILDIGGDGDDFGTNQNAAGNTGLDTGRACPAAEYHKEWCQLVGAGAVYAVSGVSGGFSKTFSVSTDYLLGIERLETVNVTGLKDEDVALLAQLADRLRENS